MTNSHASSFESLTDSLDSSLESLTELYWLASKTLSGRANMISSTTAIGHLCALGQNCGRPRLRCAAAGRLASLGLSDLIDASTAVPEGRR